MHRQRTVTMMFTDIEGSTVLVRRLHEDWGDALELHQRIVREVIRRNDGNEVDTEGDAFFAVFDDARHATSAATEVHESLATADWPQGIELKVRIGLHTGSVEQRDDRFIGLDVHKAARIGAAAHGGQTLLSEATAVLVPTEREHIAALQDLGEHRLKDIPGVVRLFQLGTQTGFPPPRALDGRVVRLPTRWSDLVGRSADAEQVRKEWDNGTRLVTIVGPAGVGKTSLALSLAHGRADAGDSAVMVALAAVLDPTEVVPQIARTLDVPAGDIDAIVAALGPGRILLVLDNFEQLRAGGSVVTALLEAVPRLDVMVTSQAPLHIAGEHVTHLEPLPSPDSARYDDIVASPAVVLFLERVAAADPAFALTSANAEAVAAICRRLDGNPLALELAAARCRSMTPHQLLERLDHSISLLRARAHSQDRHASLETAIESTLSLLPDDAKTIVDGLGVFEGGWTLEVLEEVAAEALDGEMVDVAWALDDLVDMSVVRRIDIRDGDVARFGWPTALRDVARARLAVSTDAEQRWSRAHAQAYLKLAEQACFRTGEVAEQELTAEAANLWQAIQWSAGQDPSLHARLTSVADPLALTHGQALRTHIEWALAAATDDTLRARLLVLEAYVNHALGGHSASVQLFAEAAELWARAGQPAERAKCLIEQAYLLASSDPSDRRADRWLDEADQLLASTGVTVSRAVFMRAQLMVIRHDASGARDVLDRMTDLKAQDRFTSTDRAYFDHLSADCQLLVGEFEAARTTYGAAMRRALEVNSLAQASIEAQGVAMALAGLGRCADAARLRGATDRIQHEVGFYPDYPWWNALQDRLIAEPGVTTLGEAGYHEAHEAGRRWSVDEALDVALRLSA